MRRDVVAEPSAAGGTLVVDRDAVTRADPRLVAHIAPDEPPANALLVCGEYLADDPQTRPRCRALRQADLEDGTAGREGADDHATTSTIPPEPVDPSSLAHALVAVECALSIPQLRWTRRREDEAAAEVVSLRGVVGALERYEPICQLTREAIAAHRGSPLVSTTVLRLELERVLESPIVLNRRLREVVLATVAEQGLSLSEVARRCGRLKRDRNGKHSGETSWLARRLGLLPEGGQASPTPWIHSDVLGLIARDGLALSPREVEL